MSFFKTMNIWGKLILGFSIMFIIMLSIGLTGYGSSRQINENLNEVFGVNLPSIDYLVQADRDLQQLLVAERTMIYTDVKSDDFKKLLQDYEENLDQSRDRWEKYKTLPSSPEEKAVAAEFEKARAVWEELSLKVVEGRKEDTRTGRRLAMDLSRGEASVKFEIMRGFLDKLQNLTLKDAQKVHQQAESTYRQALLAIFSVLAAGLLVGVFLAFLITRSITRPVRGVAEFAGKISRGDLTARLPMGTAVNCSRELDCNHRDCSCHGREAHCWTEVGSFASTPTCPRGKEVRDCHDCAVFKKGRLNEIDEMGASLNAMADELKKKADLATGIAMGDLDQEIAIMSENDSLGLALHTMIENLNEIMGRVNLAVTQVSSGSSQVAEASQSLSAGSSEQASAIEEITSSMAELGSKTTRNAEHASEVEQLSRATRDAAENGNKHMQDMVNSMQEISESSREIAKIIKAIDDIAFQTNLLALNAAVEAARAGKHGKGFAVVAEEVRNLAGRSAKAARETAELIEGSVKKVENGTGIVDKTADALSGIVDSAAKVTDLVAEIATASNEQALGISQVNQGLSQVESVTQQNSAFAEEAAATSEQLSGQAMQLRQLVSRFHLKAQARKLAAEYEAGPREDQNMEEEQAGGDADFWQDAAETINRQMDGGVAPEDVISLEKADYGKY